MGMKKLLFVALCLPFLAACSHDDDYEAARNAVIKENVQRVFGTSFSPDHDWCTTESKSITISNIPSGVESVQLLLHIAEDDGETSVLTLNEAEVNGQAKVTLAYDLPKNNIGLYVAFLSNDDFRLVKVNGNDVSYAGARRVTRALTTDYPIPTTVPVIGEIVESYASQRGWIPGEKLYGMAEADYASQKMVTPDYDDDFKEVFRALIFSYFKNGRSYNNLPLVKQSGVYNANAYPFTTGEEPIIVTPVYKRDGADKYGNETWNSDLYYYYYPSDANVTVEYLQSLPKYKAIPFKDCFGEKEDDVIQRKGSYALVYWGDGTPEIGTEGSYTFPEGYKIGFMVRAKTTAEGGKKQGELYADGRLDNEINSYASCNFKSSKLGKDDPRAAWLSVNGKMLLAFESGTDSDFNDVILEVEGGIEPIITIPDIDPNVYTFCFEDTEIGDYDMNDVVIKASRLSDTRVQYSVVACGANDRLFIQGIEGRKINSSTEVHQMFGKGIEFINTEKGSAKVAPVTEIVTVDKTFSFLDEATQPRIYDQKTKQTIRLATRGEDPHGIMIPYDFKYPLERVCVKNAYERFNEWGKNPIISTDWYKSPVAGNVY